MKEDEKEKTAKDFFDTWNASGGLISQADVARLFKCSSAYINQLNKEKKLNKVSTIGKKYLSFQEVFNYWKSKNKN